MTSEETIQRLKNVQRRKPSCSRLGNERGTYLWVSSGRRTIVFPNPITPFLEIGREILEEDVFLMIKRLVNLTLFEMPFQYRNYWRTDWGMDVGFHSLTQLIGEKKHALLLRVTVLTASRVFHIMAHSMNDQLTCVHISFWWGSLRSSLHQFYTPLLCNDFDRYQLA